MSDAATPTCETLLSTFPELFVRCLGDRAAVIKSVRSPEATEPGAAVFCADPRVFPQALASDAAVLVVPPKAADELESKRGAKTLLVSPNVERAMAATINRFFLKTPYTDSGFHGYHATAVIHSSVSLSEGVRVGPHAVIAAGCKLGKNVFVGANAVIEIGTEIGADSVIHPLVYIGHGTRIGARCEILPNTTIAKEGFGYAHDEKGNHYRIPHQGRVVIEDDVHIGAGGSIDRGTFGETRIGAGTKLDNQVHIAHNCRIGRNCLLTAGFAIAGSSTIGDNFVAGGSSTVTGHIEIGNDVQVSGMSTVTKDITEPGQYGGFPLLPLRQHLKVRAALVHLPEMRRQLSQLMKKFFPEDSGED